MFKTNYWRLLLCDMMVNPDFYVYQLTLTSNYQNVSYGLKKYDLLRKFNNIRNERKSYIFSYQKYYNC